MELDPLIAEVGAEAIARFRRPRMTRDEAEAALARLQAMLGDRAPTGAPARAPRPSPPVHTTPADLAPSPTSEATGRPITGSRGITALPPLPTIIRGIDAPPADDPAEHTGGRARSLREAAQRVTGGHRAVAQRPAAQRPAAQRPAAQRPAARAGRERDTVDRITDPFLDQDRGVARQGHRPAPRSALLRPPSRPLPRLSPPSPTPDEPLDPPASATRAAMGALFDDDSGGGLVLFGEGGDDADGFAPQVGTDPAMAPLPDDARGAEPDEPACERTADEPHNSLASVHPDADTDGPDPMAEARLAGAESSLPMDVPAAPFGFGPGDAEPTRVDRPVRRPTPSTPPDRHAPGHLSEDVVVNSVRKLFRR